MDTDLGDGSSRIVGAKQLTKALKQGTIQIVYLAKDADQHVVEPIRQAAGAEVMIIEVETMEQLGRACGIQVGAAVAGVLKQPASL